MRAALLFLLQQCAFCQNHSHDSLEEGVRGASALHDLSSYIKIPGGFPADLSKICAMNAWTGPPQWINANTFSYTSLETCADLCQAQADCAAFLDEISRQACVFFLSAATGRNDFSMKTDWYEKSSPPSPSPSPPGPPAPPAPPVSACLGGWPEFASPAQLQANAWGTYFKLVYGEVPAFTYPFCVGDLWFFYDDLIASSGAGVTAPPIKGNCPSSTSPEGERYRQNNAYQAEGVSYSWHRPPYAAIASSTWVEVSHAADPFGDERFGMWFLLAPGKGVWFNTGVTTTFADHQHAYDTFGISPSGVMNEAMCQVGKSRGFDSLQFTKWTDHVNYPCDTSAGAPYMNLEIVAVKLTGTYACGASGGAPDVIRWGWKGSSACSCDESSGHLNCGVSAGRLKHIVA